VDHTSASNKQQITDGFAWAMVGILIIIVEIVVITVIIIVME